MSHGTGWTRVTEDGIINEGQTLLYSLLISTEDGEGEASIYEGLDATSGRLIHAFKESDSVITDPKWDPPLRLDRGLYIDFGTKTNAILVQWDPVISGRLLKHEET